MSASTRKPKPKLKIENHSSTVVPKPVFNAIAYDSMDSDNQQSSIFTSEDGLFSSGAPSTPSVEEAATPPLEFPVNRVPVENLEEICEIVAGMVRAKLEEEKRKNSLWQRARKWLGRVKGSE